MTPAPVAPVGGSLLAGSMSVVVDTLVTSVGAAAVVVTYVVLADVVLLHGKPDLSVNLLR